MGGMFSASAFNRDISGWAVHSVVNMQMMFDGSAFNQDIGGWAVQSVTDMRYMFASASAFDQDLGWGVDDDVSLDSAFPGTVCSSTLCGVGQKDANGVCIFTTLAPTLRPTPAPTPTPIVDAAHRLSGVSAALLVLALAAS